MTGQPQSPQPVAGIRRIAPVRPGGAVRASFHTRSACGSFSISAPSCSQRSQSSQSSAKIPVRIVAPAVNRLAPEHGGRVADRRIPEAVAADLCGGLQAVLPVHEMRKAVGSGAITAKSGQTGRKRECVLAPEVGGLKGQPQGMGRVVGIHAGDEGAWRRCQSGVEGGDNAAVRQVQNTQPAQGGFFGGAGFSRAAQLPSVNRH